MTTATTLRVLVKMSSLLLTALLATAGNLPAAAAEMHHFNVAARDAATAIQEFGTQSGVQILAGGEELRGKQLNSVTGKITTDEGLRRLLDGTGLTHRYVGERAIALVPADASAAAHDLPPSAAAGAAGPGLRLAHAATDDAPDTRAASGGEEARHTVGDKSDEVMQKGVPEIMVKGRRSGSTDMQRTEDDVQPYVVFTAEEIENSMAGDIESFLRTRLSMNQAAGTESMSDGLRGAQSTINLRGLGSDETLILVNGRRQPSIAQPSGLGVYQPDINGIPLSSIERIEVLPSTAGGIYGGGATGGVVNVILKRGYRGLEVRGTYDGTTNGGNHKRRLEASGGLSLEGGRTSLSFAASYSDAAPLLNGDRDLASKARAQLLENDPESVLTAFQGAPIGYTTNIESASGSPLVLVSTGQSLGSARAHVPLGYAGPGSDGGAAFLGTAGSFNTNLPNEAITDGLRRHLLAAPTIRSINLNLRREFTDRIEAFVDVSNYDNRAISYYISSRNGNATTVPVGPSNPFTEPVKIGLPLANFDRRVEEQPSWAQTRSLAGGVIARLPANWSAQAEYSWNRSRSSSKRNPYQITADGEAAIKDGRLDPFRDVNAYPLDFSPYYVSPTPQTIYGGDFVLKTATLRLAGPVWRLPAGPLMLSTMVERRDELDKANVNTLHARDGTPAYSYYPGNVSTTDSAYIELTVPLVSAPNARPGIQGLELQASYRYDRADIALRSWADVAVVIPSPEGPYPQSDTIDISTDANQYTFGFRYQPFQQLALRASLGEGVLPPSVVQLAPREFAPNLFPILGGRLADPKRGGGPLISLIRYAATGNPSLQPEESESISAGLIFTPLSIPGLRVSIDYTRIDKLNEISSVGAQVLLDLEDEAFSDRIVRGALTPADQALGYTAGPVLEFDTGPVNVARSLMEAFDAQIDYTWQTHYGEFKASMMGTVQPHLLQQILADQPTEEYVNTNSGPLKLRTNAGLTWTRENWALGWNMQYYGSYLITSPGASNNPDRLRRNGGSPDIPAQHYHDLFGRYRFGDRSGSGWSGLLSNAELWISVKNVLDTELPIAFDNGFFRFSPYGDPRLRSYAITLSKSFQ